MRVSVHTVKQGMCCVSVMITITAISTTHSSLFHRDQYCVMVWLRVYYVMSVPVVYCEMVEWLLCTMWWCACCVLCDGVTKLCTMWWCECCVLCDGVPECSCVIVCDMCSYCDWCALSCVLCDGVTVVYCEMSNDWVCTMWCVHNWLQTHLLDTLTLHTEHT